MHANQIQTWYNQLKDNMVSLFDSDIDHRKDHEKQIKPLQVKIGQLAMESDFFCDSAQAMSQSWRKDKINTTHDLSVVHQCQLLSISRTSMYYQSKVVMMAN